MSERQVTVTDDDVRFVRKALEHYRAFGDASEGQNPIVASVQRWPTSMEGSW
jgi:hypothetical protein